MIGLHCSHLSSWTTLTPHCFFDGFSTLISLSRLNTVFILYIGSKTHLILIKFLPQYPKQYHHHLLDLKKSPKNDFFYAYGFYSIIDDFSRQLLAFAFAYFKWSKIALYVILSTFQILFKLVSYFSSMLFNLLSRPITLS